MSVLSGSNVHYFYESAEYWLREMAASGLTAAELYLGTPHVFVDSHSRQDLEDIVGISQRFGVQFTAVHPETLSFRYTLCSPDPDWNRKSVDTFCNCLRYAAEHKIARLNTNLSGAFRDDDPARVLHQLTGDLVVIGQCAADLGLKIGLETESRLYQGFISNLSSLSLLMRELEKHVPDVFDVVLNYDAIRDSEETIAQWFDLFGDRITTVRFGSADDYPLLKRQCQARGFDGVYQFYPLDDPSLLQPAAADRTLAERAGVR